MAVLEYGSVHRNSSKLSGIPIPLLLKVSIFITHQFWIISVVVCLLGDKVVERCGWRYFRDWLVTRITCKFVVTTLLSSVCFVHVGLGNLTMGCPNLVQIQT